jgi:hypothetical protein
MDKDINHEILELLIVLLKTNSPSKRLEAVLKWANDYGYKSEVLVPITSLLEAQKAEKANQGAIGGKGLRKVQEQCEQTAILKEMRDLMSQGVGLAPAKAKKTKELAQDFTSPMWAWKCSALCTHCGDKIDGCAFRWKKQGVYSSYHPTCIPTEHQSLFENIKGYRDYFKLDTV